MNSSVQRGTAIISVLLIVTVVAVIIANQIARQSIFIRSLESEQLRVQGSWMLRGSVEWSRRLLLEDSRHDPLTHLDQRWAHSFRDLRLSEPELLFNGLIEDEQGKFNLHNLILDQRRDERELANFERLTALLGISPQETRLIVERVLNSFTLLPAKMIVADTNPLDSGRETTPGTVRRLIPATAPPLRRLDDLARVSGIRATTLERLRPFVTLLPSNTWINGNTVRAEVLAACVLGLSLEHARRVLGERDQGRWFLNRGDFINRLNLPLLQVRIGHIGITSDWFLLSAYTRRKRQQVSLQALLHRQSGESVAVAWMRVGS